MEQTVNYPPVNSWKRILDCAMYIGKKLLENGAEIHRAEETIEYICKAYGCYTIDVYAIPNMITATVEANDDYYTSKIKRVKSPNNNLYLVEKLNEISRYVCENKPSIEEFEKLLWDFSELKTPKYPILLYIGAFIGCFGFAMGFGGTIRDGLAAGVVAVIMGLYLFNKHVIINKTVDTLLISIIGGFLSALACAIHLGEHVSYVMIGSIMMVIPGMAISTSFKDIMMDDLMSGTLRLLQSVATALIIAIGYSVAIVVFKDNIEILVNTQPVWLKIITLALGGVGFGMVFNNNYRHFPLIIVGCVSIATIFTICLEFDIPVLASTLLAALFGLLYAEICARIYKCPSICILTTELVVLAPGGALYYAMFSFWNREAQAADFQGYLLRTFYISFGIGAGIILGSVIVSLVLKFIKWYKIKKEEKNKENKSM